MGIKYSKERYQPINRKGQLVIYDLKLNIGTMDLKYKKVRGNLFISPLTFHDFLVFNSNSISKHPAVYLFL